MRLTESKIASVFPITDYKTEDEISWWERTHGLMVDGTINDEKLSFVEACAKKCWISEEHSKSWKIYANWGNRPYLEFKENWADENGNEIWLNDDEASLLYEMSEIHSLRLLEISKDGFFENKEMQDKAFKYLPEKLKNIVESLINDRKGSEIFEKYIEEADIDYGNGRDFGIYINYTALEADYEAGRIAPYQKNKIIEKE